MAINPEEISPGYHDRLEAQRAAMTKPYRDADPAYMFRHKFLLPAGPYKGRSLEATPREHLRDLADGREEYPSITKPVRQHIRRFLEERPL